MKRRNIIYVLLASVALLFAACNKQVAPSGSLQIYQTGDYDLGIDKPLADGERIYSNVVMVFVAKDADGDVYSLWKGDKASDYKNARISETKEGDENFVGANPTGVAMTKSKGQFMVKTFYDEPGEYTATLVGRNIYEKGAEYKETIYTKNVVVVDTACFLDLLNSTHRFRFSAPADANTKVEQLPGYKIQPYFKASVMASASNASMQISAGKASIWYNGVELPYNTSRGYYTWSNVDLTSAKELVIKARSEGFERTYTVLPVKLWE
ncbi:MAG: hypothetical protein FWC39_02450 [Bacteroidetes bacterium]|nr:hypothetical protein [Bacteroidota bacterium]